jgi:hypothetical protein
LLLDPQSGEPMRRGRVLMFDVLKPEFRSWWAEAVGKGVRESGADGLFVDQMHGFAFHRQQQKSEVDAAQAEMMRMAKKAIGPEKILLLNNGAHIPALFEIGDAFMFEHYKTDQLTKEAIVADWDLMKNGPRRDRLRKTRARTASLSPSSFSYRCPALLLLPIRLGLESSGWFAR